MTRLHLWIVTWPHNNTCTVESFDQYGARLLATRRYGAPADAHVRKAQTNDDRY